MSKVDYSDRDAVQAILKRLVREIAEFDIGDIITDKSSFVMDLGYDSLMHVELLMAVEEEFSLEIPDPEANDLDTFGKMTDYLMKAKAA